jgi:SAM-dependent methyltransferase
MAGLPRDASINEVKRRLLLANAELAEDEVQRVLHKARVSAFDAKYGERLSHLDERTTNLDQWRLEFVNVLNSVAGEEWIGRDLLVVGIGNGSEAVGTIERARSVRAVDISQRSLHSVRERFPHFSVLLSSAENLDVIDAGSVDLYISLRTYQSSLFDVDAALFEAFRVLRRGGHMIVSIPHTYYLDGRFVEGMSPPGSREVQVDLPYVIAEEVRHGMSRLGATSVGIRTGLFEVYVYGRRK